MRLFILGHCFTTVSMSCVFDFYLKRFSRRRFCRKFQVLSLSNENDRNKRVEILKVLRDQLFLVHSLDMICTFRSMMFTLAASRIRCAGDQ